MFFQVIVTVSEKLLSSPDKLKAIDACGDCIYRINGAHISGAGLDKFTDELRGILGEPRILLDLPGNKIRIKGLSDPMPLMKGEIFELHSHSITYPRMFSYLKPGDKIMTNDSTLPLEVVSVNDKTVELTSLLDGILINNRGLHVSGIHHSIPFLFDKDKELIAAAARTKIDNISLSFVRTAEDIIEAKKEVLSNNGGPVTFFAKIETSSALDNLGRIFKEVDHVNVDRGDLSTDVGMLKLPAIQERVIESAKRAKKKIYLATQFLKNMELNPVPLIAEVMDLHNTIKSGVSGVQLSEETAIGRFPVECVKLVFDTFHQSFSG